MNLRQAVPAASHEPAAEPAEEGLVLYDAAGRVAFANAAAARLTGFEGSATLLGKSRAELLRQLAPVDEHGRSLPGARESGWPPPVELRALELRLTVPGAARELRVVVTSTPVRDAAGALVQVVDVLRDVTVRRRAERMARLLARIDGLLADPLDFRATTKDVVRLLVPELADWCSLECGTRDGRPWANEVAHRDPALEETLREMRQRFPLPPDGSDGIGVVIQPGKPALLAEMTPDRLRTYAANEEHVQLLLTVGTRSSMVLPLTARGRVLGILVLALASIDRRFGEADLAAATELSDRLALWLDKALLVQEGREAMARARQSEARLALALEVGRMGYFDRNLRTGELNISPSLAALYDDYLAVTSTSMDFAQVTHPDDLPEMQEQLARCTRGETDSFHVLYRLRPRPDGEVRWVESYGRSVRDEHGTPVHLLGIALEATDRVQAEQAQAAHAAELARSNAELERFAYVASHDLQEPLRTVGSYMDLLQRRYRDKLDPDAQDFIGFAVDGVKRMKALIDDLLAYSRVDTQSKPFAPVSMAEVMRHVLGNLKATVEEHRAEVGVGPLPDVRGDAGQLEQVLQNLVGNAIKFHSPDKSPRVDVVAERAGAEWRFSVKDNGIGIEPEYFDRLFVLFQRLHSRGEYPGTGLGLAICKKIIERHGGRIWLESAPGTGSTFCFTLPAAPP